MKNEIFIAPVIEKVPVIATDNAKTVNSNCSVTTQANSSSNQKSQPEFNYDQYSRKIHDCIASFAAELCSSTHISRSCALSLVQNCNRVNQEIFSELVIISKRRPLVDTDIECLAKIADNGFSLFDSDHKVSKIFEQLHTYIPSYSKEIRYTLKLKRKKRRRELTVDTIKIEVVPIGVILKSFLELPAVYETIMAHMEKCRVSEEIISPIQGLLWRDIQSRFAADQVVMPITIFEDHY